MICGQLNTGLRRRPTKTAPKATALQTEYIIASRKAASYRERITLTAVSFGLLVAIALAIVGWRQRTEAMKNADEANRQKEEAMEQEGKAKDQTRAAKKETSEVASRGNVSLARYSAGKKGRTLKPWPNLPRRCGSIRKIGKPRT